MYVTRHFCKYSNTVFLNLKEWTLMGHLKPVCRICVCLQIGEVLNCCQQSFRLIIVWSAVLKLRKWRHMNCIEFVQLSAARIFCVVSQLRSSSSSRRARQFQICVQSHSLRLTRGQTNQTNLKTGILHCRSSQLSRWALLSHRRSSKKSPNSLQSHFLHHYSRLVKKSTHKPQAI